jgi:hypothetical protein
MILKIQQVIKLLKKEKIIQNLLEKEEKAILDLTEKKVIFEFSSDQTGLKVVQNGDYVEINKEIGAFILQSETKKEYCFLDSIFYISIEENEE